MEKSLRMTHISQIEETPLIFYEETSTNIPSSSFLTSIFYGVLERDFLDRKFWVLGNEV